MRQNRNGCRVVPLAERHAAQIAAIERQCFSTPWSEQAIREDVGNPLAVYFVCEREEAGQYDGCAPCGSLPKGTAPTVLGYLGTRVIQPEAEVTNLAVRPDCRRQGIGSLLLESLVAYCGKHNVATISLEVRQSNRPARMLYRAFGFEEVGLRRNFYVDPAEDAVLMTKYLEM